MAIEKGCLLLADISGYTKYLTGVELDHSQDILADLLSAVVEHLKSRLELAKLEGDAVFCYRGDDESDRLDGAALVTLVEGCYFAFERKLRNIKSLTTCQCDACILIPDLRLKFLAHHGQYVLHEVVGNRELVGPDVILAHRLLKNTVTERTGLRGYALFTQAAVQRFGIDPAVAGMSDHTESYDDVGEVFGYLHDLERRWLEEQKRERAYVGPDDALFEVVQEVPAPPPVVWEIMTSPAKRAVWQPDTVRIDQDNPLGIPGVGTTNHCVHGGGMTVDEEILDWKPFDYFTERSRGAFGASVFTFEITPIDDATSRVAARARPEPESEEAFAGIREQFAEIMRVYMDRLRAYVEGELVPG